jgi:hypothetical protein
MPDMIVASTTATQKEIDHAVSADWRMPIADEVPEPEKSAVEAEPATSEEEVETAPASEPEPEQEVTPAKGKGGFQKKIDKLTREKSQAEQRADTLERELAEFKERFAAIEQRLAPAATKPEVKTAPEVPGKPLESEIGTKFKTWDEYNEALIDWKAEQRVNAALAKRDESEQQREQRETAEARQQQYSEASEEFVKEHPDFNQAIDNATKAGMKLPESIIERIKDLPNGPAVTYYLVTNPDEALALVQADIETGFIMLGRISYGLESDATPKTEPVKPPAKKPISTAPAAVKPVAGHSARSSNAPDEMSKSQPDAYIRLRIQQIKEREARRY